MYTCIQYDTIPGVACLDAVHGRLAVVWLDYLLLLAACHSPPHLPLLLDWAVWSPGSPGPLLLPAPFGAEGVNETGGSQIWDCCWTRQSWMWTEQWRMEALGGWVLGETVGELGHAEVCMWSGDGGKGRGARG